MNEKTPQPSSATIESAPAQTRKKVLLVDDDAQLLRGLERSFVDENYDLLTAVSAAEARVFLTKEPVDLVLSDNLMPGEFGTDFLASVRKDYPHIKLMIFSGYMPAGAVRRAIEEIGVHRVISKPCRSSDIATAIREVLSD